MATVHLLYTIMMVFGGGICRNGYFYETYDGNMHFEYTSRDVKYEQYQNQASYDTLLNMINSGVVPCTQMTYPCFQYQEYPDANIPETIPCDLVTRTKMEKNVEKQNKVPHTVTRKDEEKEKKNFTIINMDKLGIETSKPHNLCFGDFHSGNEDMDVAVETVVTVDEDEIEHNLQWEIPLKRAKLQKVKRDQIYTENRFEMLSDDEEEDNVPEVVTVVSMDSCEINDSLPDKENMTNESNVVMVSSVHSSGTHMKQDKTNEKSNDISEKLEDVVQMWRSKASGAEYGVAVKRMSYLSRTTQLLKEIEKALEVNTNQALVKMQEENIRIQHDIIGTDNEKVFNLNAIRFENINIQFGEIVQLIRNEEKKCDRKRCNQ